MQRIVEPEILDTLEPEHPSAIANRKDLRLYNRLMGNPRWFAAQLKNHDTKSPILEIGAGDGFVGMYLNNNDIVKDSTAYTGLDRIAKPAGWPDTWGWLQQDLLEYRFDGSHKILLGNLILHQFANKTLRQLGKRIQKSQVSAILLNEPARRNLHIWQVCLSRLLRVHPVTLHDAKVSVRAGFRRDELASCLGLLEDEWSIQYQETFMGSNRLVCVRK